MSIISNLFSQKLMRAAAQKQNDMSFVAVQIYQLCKASHKLGSRADIVLLNLMRQGQEYADITAQENPTSKRLLEQFNITPPPPLTIRITLSGHVSLFDDNAAGTTPRDSFMLDTQTSGREMLNTLIRYLINDPKDIFKDSAYDFPRGLASAPAQRLDTF